MEGKSFFETEVLSATLRSAVSRVGATASLPEKIEAVIEDQAAEDLNAALVALIKIFPLQRSKSLRNHLHLIPDREVWHFVLNALPTQMGVLRRCYSFE